MAIYKRHKYCSAISLMIAISETKEENVQRVKEGKEPYTLSLDLHGGSTDGYEAMGVYDLLSFHADLAIEVRALAEITIVDLAILAGVPQGKAFISASTQILPYDIGSFAWGEYKDLKLAEESVKQQRDRMFAAISSAFTFTREAIEDTVLNSKLLVAADGEAMGLRILGRTNGEA